MFNINAIDNIERKIKELQERKISIVNNSCFVNGDLTEKEWKEYCKIEKQIEKLEIIAEEIEKGIL